MIPIYDHHHHGLLFSFSGLFFSFSLIVRPLVGITDYTRSELLNYHIIAIYHYFVQDPYRLNCVVSYYLAVLFKRDGSVSPSPWFIVFFVVFLFFLLEYECNHSLVSPITSEVLSQYFCIIN